MRARRIAPLVVLLLVVSAGVDGAGSAIVIGNDAPAWSPDGAKIAFTAFRHGNGEIYTMATNGRMQVRLTRTEAHDDHASWSPDGTRIAFSSTRDGNYEVYVMNANGSDILRLTDHPQADYGPAWSPDGTRIAWRTNRDGNPEIYSMNPDGSDQRRLTTDRSADESPDWSSDGRIAFSSNRDGGIFNIYVMDADGSNVTRVTSGRTNKHEPDWSPDASRLVYVADGVLPIGNTEIYAVGADGTGERRLTDYEGRDDWPTWSPDGSKILFTRGVTFRAQDIFSANVDGTGLTKLTQTAAKLEVTDADAAVPRAGARWTIRVLVDDARGLPITGATPICRTLLGGKAFRAAGATVLDGVVRCAWNLPKSARAKLLRGVAGLRVGSLRAELPFSLRVR
jgi:Tol biopolymer transport system component